MLNNRRSGLRIAALVMACALLLMMGLTGCGKKTPQTAELALPANPTTGYQWVVKQEPEIFEITSKYKSHTKDPNLVGVGGTETFTLVPKQKGKTVINFYYQQPWDDSSLNERLTYEVTVDKNLQIKVDSQSGEMTGDGTELETIPEMEIK